MIEEETQRKAESNEFHSIYCRGEEKEAYNEVLVCWRVGKRDHLALVIRLNWR